MYAFERQEAIARRVRELGRVSVSDLAQAFDASVETIRRDLGVRHRTGAGFTLRGHVVNITPQRRASALPGSAAA